MWRATFETTTQHPDPEANISEFLDAIESLTGADAELWQRCSKREFNIGYECGCGPGPAMEHVLSTQLLARLVAAGAAMGFTIYQVDDTS